MRNDIFHCFRNLKYFKCFSSGVGCLWWQGDSWNLNSCSSSPCLSISDLSLWKYGWESSFVCVFCFILGGKGRSFGNCSILLLVCSMKLEMCMVVDVISDKLIHGDKRATILCLGTNQKKEKEGISWLLFTCCSIFRQELSLFWQLKSFILMWALRYCCNTVNTKWELSFCF